MKYTLLALTAILALNACKQNDAVSNCYTCHKVADTINRYPWHGGHKNYWYGDTILCGDTAAIAHLANMKEYTDSVQKEFTDTSGTHTFWAVYRQRFDCVH